MKLVIYFGLMVLSLVISLTIGQFLLKRYKNLWKSFLLSLFVNIFILGLSSVWWVLTETDGLSQGFGVIYYCIAMSVISVINLIVLKIVKTKQKEA